MESQRSEPFDWLGWFKTVARGSPRRKEYVGMTLLDALDSIGTAEPTRVIDTNATEEASASGHVTMLTANAVPNRVNLLVRDGVVLAAATF